MCVCSIFPFSNCRCRTIDMQSISFSLFHRASASSWFVPFLFHDTWTARVDDVSEFNFLFKPSIIYNILIQDTLFALCSSDLHPSKYRVCGTWHWCYICAEMNYSPEGPDSSLRIRSIALRRASTSTSPFPVELS